MKRPLTIALTLLISALIFTACRTAPRSRATPIFVPYGTNNYGSVDWWTNAVPNYTNEVLIWQAIKAIDTNFARLAGQLQGQGIIGAGGYAVGTNNVVDSGTNYVIDFLSARYQVILATNDVAIRQTTNGPGAAAVKIYPLGTNRVVAFPTNWVWAATNGFSLTNGQWQMVLTNSARAALLEVQCETAGSASYQSNVWARFTIGQP